METLHLKPSASVRGSDWDTAEVLMICKWNNANKTNKCAIIAK